MNDSCPISDPEIGELGDNMLMIAIIGVVGIAIVVIITVFVYCYYTRPQEVIPETVQVNIGRNS